MRTPEGKELYDLTTAFDFNIMPWQFLQMTNNQIELLLGMKEKYVKERRLNE